MRRQKTKMSKELESAVEFISLLKEIPREDRSRIEGILIGFYLKQEEGSKDPPNKDSA